MSPLILSVYAVGEAGADGVADHARLLMNAVAEINCDTDLIPVNWRSRGWLRAFIQIARLRQRGPDLIVLHYSHLGWTRRGLPIGLLAIVTMCRSAGPVLLWVHDPGPVPGYRFRQRAGSAAKKSGLRLASAIAGDVVVTVDPKQVYWLQEGASVKFCPSPTNVATAEWSPPEDLFTVSCFGTRLTANATNVAIIEDVCAGLAVRIGPFRLRLLGENPPLAEGVEARLRQRGVELDLAGPMSAEALGAQLARSHVFWHTRSGLTTRSGTLAAALSCGLPIVGMLGDETGFPLDQGGLAIVGDKDTDGVVKALAALAQSPMTQERLSRASLAISANHYSWAHARDLVLAATESRVKTEPGCHAL